MARATSLPPLPATPAASSEATRRAMQGNRRADTAPELALRRALHRRGFRYRKDAPIRLEGLTVRPDIVFTRQRVCVFSDGCYWHRCPQHCRLPASNRDYWVAKIERNVARDRQIDAALSEAGWRVVRVWEHVPVEEAVGIVTAALRA